MYSSHLMILASRYSFRSLYLSFRAALVYIVLVASLPQHALQNGNLAAKYFLPSIEVEECWIKKTHIFAIVFHKTPKDVDIER